VIRLASRCLSALVLVALLALPLSAATVADVSSTAGAGAHLGLGTPIDITVTFNATAAIDVSGGQPTLTLNDGGTALYTGTSGTSSTMTFRYTVHAADVTAALDATAMVLNGATLDGTTTAPALPTGSDPASLATLRHLTIDGSRTGIVGITSSASGRKGAGASIPITVTFARTMTVVGTIDSTLDLNSGGTAIWGGAANGPVTGTTFTFTYTVLPGENATALNVLAFNPNDAAYTDSNAKSELTDVPAAGAVGALNVGQTIIVDTTPAPTVTAVTTTHAAGTVGTNVAIPFLVDFSAPVTVTGTPTLALSLPGRSATYTGGSGTSELAFSYTTAANDNANPLALSGTGALSGTIQDAYTAPATLTLPIATLNHAIVVDTAPPTVALSSTAAIAGPNRPVTVAIAFSEAVTGFTSLNLTNGTLVSGPTGSGTAWTAQVLATGPGALGVQVAANSALDVAGNGNTASSTFSLNYDGTAPTASLFTTATAAGPAHPTPVIVTFSSPVVGFATTGLVLGSATLQSGPTTTDGGSTWNLVLQATGPGDLTAQVAANAAQDAAGNPNLASVLPLTLPYDGTSPTVLVTPSGNTTNAPPVFFLTFSESVTAAPAISALSLANGTASTPTGTGANYTVNVTPAPTATIAGQTTINSSTIYLSAAQATTLPAFTPVAIAGTTYLTTNGAPVIIPAPPASAVPVTLASPVVSALPANTPVFATPVAVGCQVAAGAASDPAGNASLVSATATQTYDPIAPLALITPAVANTGTSPVFFNLRMSKPVTGLVASDITSNGTVTALAALPSGVDYQIQVIPNAVGTVTCRLPAGMVYDLAGNANQGSNTGQCVFDNRTLAVSINATGTSPTNANQIPFTVSFNKPLPAGTFTAADLVATNGTVTSVGENATHDTFSIQVAPASDGTVSLQVADGVVADQYGIIYHQQAADRASVVSDRTAPVITALSVTNATGTYGLGANITINATWSETINVTVVGTQRPGFLLDAGTSATAAYASGTGTTTTTFSYTVATGDVADPLALAANALLVQSSEITDTAGNPAATALPALSGGAAVIDTSPATITGVDSTLANGVYGSGQVVPVVVHFSKAVQVTGTPTLSLATGAADTVVTYTSGSGGTTLTFTYTVAAGQTAADLDYDGVNALSLHGGAITDLFKNPANLTLPTAASGLSLAGTRTLVVNTTDTTVPVVTTTAFTSPSGTYGTGATVAITVTFNRTVGVVGTPFLVMNDIAGGHTTPTARYTGGSGTNVLAFTYTVASSDSTNALGYADSGALRVDSADTISNVSVPANTTLPAPGAAGSLEASAAIAVNPGGGGTGKPPATTLPSASGSTATCGLGSGIALFFATLLLIRRPRRAAPARRQVPSRP
jgi:hypothetical protein